MTKGYPLIKVYFVRHLFFLMQYMCLVEQTALRHLKQTDAVHFLNEAFKHCKAIAASDQAIQVLEATYFSKKLPADYSDESVLREGIVIGNNADKIAKQFISAIALHRFWEREKPRKVPA